MAGRINSFDTAPKPILLWGSFYARGKNNAPNLTIDRVRN